MPKNKKSKKARRNNNKKQEVVEETKETKTEIDIGENEVPKITTTDVDGIDKNVEDNPQPETEEVPKEEELENSKISKKKRFSLFKKKNQSDNLNNMENSTNDKTKSAEGVTVKRAHSISVFGREEHQPKSKIPLHKFRGQGNKKRAMTSSSSNIETTSLVLNPGMDSWRMEGLLGTVEKSNSVHSLHSTGDSPENEEPNIALESPHPKQEAKEKDKEKLDSKKIDVLIESPKKVEEEKQAEVTTADKPVEVTRNVSPKTEADQDKDEDFVQTNIDFEYSAEIHEKSVNPPPALSTPATTPAETPIQVSPPIVSKISSPATIEVTATVESPASNTSSPAAKMYETELYEFENNRVVTVRNLDDVIHESKMKLPDQIIPNDWLVLHLSTTPVIESF